jgi:hypothetical protein
VVGSARSAPGATTVTLGLAATWPTSRQVVIWEADPDGGVLAARYQLGDRPGLSTLAATIRQGKLTHDVLWHHTQQLPGGTPVVVGAESAEQAHVILSDVGDRLSSWFQRNASVDVIADAGRLSPSSPAVPLAEQADVTVMVARPVLEELRAGGHRLHSLVAGGATAGWVLVGDGPYNAAEVEKSFSLPVFAQLPVDVKAADVLSRGGSSKALSRSLLMRTIRSLAEDLTLKLGAQAPPRPAETGSPSGAVAVERGVT